MDVFDAIGARRSVRRFADAPVDLDDIRTMITAAHRAPSAYNSQPWRFVVITNRGLLQRMADAVTHRMTDILGSPILTDDDRERYESYRFYFSFFGTAPAVIAVYAIREESETAVIEELAEPGSRSMRGIDPIQQSVAAATQNLLLAATALGYSTTWVTGALVAKRDLEELVGRPVGWDLLALVPIGRPAREAKPKPTRPIEDIYEVIE